MDVAEGSGQIIEVPVERYFDSISRLVVLGAQI